MHQKGSVRTTKETRNVEWRSARLVVFAFLLVAAFTTLLFGTTVNAQTNGAEKQLNAVAGAAGLGGSDLLTIIGRIISIALGFVGIILLGLLLFAGYLWMTSGGDKEKVDRAKSYIRNAIIGLIIIASSFAITRFILNALGGATGRGGGGVGPTAATPLTLGFPSRAGSLGEVIENNIPARNATGVMRNTAIVIAFKEPIRIRSIIRDYNDNGTPSNLADDPGAATTIGLNNDAIRIYPTGHEDQALTTAQVRVRFTPDRKTFVLRPVALLGSPTTNMAYTVDLVSGSRGVLAEDGTSLFRGLSRAGYTWPFEVSTLVDTTPPHVASVIPPAGGQYAPNAVIQVNFSESIDPTSVSTTTMIVSSVPVATPAASPSRVRGEWQTPNHAQTAEFNTDVPCGTNSCGRTVYCLPINATLTTLVHAASLSSSPPQSSGIYDGVMDLAGNSLDGNNDGVAQGSNTDAVTGDDGYTWSFGTDARPILTAPQILSTSPPSGSRARWPDGSSQIPVDQKPEATFDNILQSSTVNSDTARLAASEPRAFDNTFWFTVTQQFLSTAGRVTAGKVVINHRNYIPATSTVPGAFVPEYDPFILSGVQSMYQNCFNPARACTRGTVGDNCCSDAKSSSACPYPPTPSPRP